VPRQQLRRRRDLGEAAAGPRETLGDRRDRVHGGARHRLDLFERARDILEHRERSVRRAAVAAEGGPALLPVILRGAFLARDRREVERGEQRRDVAGPLAAEAGVFLDDARPQPLELGRVAAASRPGRGIERRLA